MQFLHRLPFKHKLVATAMLVNVAALAVAFSAFVICEQVADRKQMAQSLNTTAALTAANVTVNRSLNEADAAEHLKVLLAQPDIIKACVYDQNGRPIARYVRDVALKNSPPPPAGNEGCDFNHNRLQLFRPITLAGQTVGTIYLEEDLSQMTAWLRQYALIGAVIMLASTWVAFFLSTRLQKVISGPLSDLMATVAVVRTKKDYSVRAPAHGDGELGSLIDGFNEMLAQIQERDINLERRVASRTQELAESLSVLDATLSATENGILVVNAEGKKIFQNQRMTNLWKISTEIADDPDDNTQVLYAASIVADPVKFKERIAYYNAHPGETGQDELELKDGTIMERITGPVLDKAGRNFGRIWTFRDVTQNRKYEAALRESQVRFKFIFQSVPVGIASHMVHPDGRVTREINNAHLRICGLTREQHDVPGIYAKLIHPADFERQQEYMRQVNAGQIDQFSLEKRYLRLDGTMVWTAFSYQRQRYGDGGFEELTTVVDITKIKRAEEALRESEASYHSLVDQMPAGVFRKDKDGRYVFVNSWFCRAKGVKPEDFLGKLPHEINGASQPSNGNESDTAILAAAGKEHHAVIMRTGRQIEFDEKCSGPDGKISYFHAVKSPVFGPDGSVTGSQGILLDVTQRKVVETELAYERGLLRTLLESSEDSIYFKDLQSRFIVSSHSQSRKFGATPEQVVGHTDFDFFAEEHARPAFEDEQTIIRTGQPIVSKVEREAWKNGRKESWVLTTKMPLRNNTGEIIGTFGISKDITPIKEAEARLEAVNRQLLETSRLAGMAEVATSVLHNVGNVLNSVNVSTTLALELVKKSRLGYVGRIACLINEQRDPADFFANDPRGKQLPGYLTKLAEHLVAEQAELVAEIELTRKNIEHIKDIVTMQQNYAKVSGVAEKVMVMDLVEDALRMNAGALTRHEVAVIRDFPEAPVECNVERPKVLQILVNLIRNAKYACDESGRADKRVTLQVRTADGRAQIATIDNGVGIPAENMTRIFNHGFTTRQGGHGFGLHSGALAAKELGGSLAAYSDGPGTGARFVLEFPLQPPQK